MKKLSVIVTSISILLFNISIAVADEGMWLLTLLGKNYEQMKKEGFKLTPEDVYHVNQGCLKDAVVGLGREGQPFRHFCTGEIISQQGLMTTNHHCGYGVIQSHSSVEHDYLRDGFWAKSQAEELPNEGITASILVRIEDVTNKILADLSEEMGEADRNKKIQEISAQLAKEATEGTDYNAYVADMFSKNQFFLFVYIIYKDVRLVGAPPSSMGKFGGDTDNWEWPRHTADFSMFRIYTAPDGKPALYAKDNVPLNPKHFFPVSIKGLNEGDFSMIMGFPGTTNRFLTSYGLEETMHLNQLRYDIRTEKINVLRKEMAASQKINIQYASKYAQCSNYWKYSHEQNKALKNLNTMAVKQEVEKQYLNWANAHADPAYKGALILLQQAYDSRKDFITARTYIAEGLLMGPELLYFAISLNALNEALVKNDTEKVAQTVEALRKESQEFYKDFDIEVERKVFKALLEYTYKNMDKQYYPAFIENVFEKKFKADANKYVDYLLSKSFFVSQEKFNAFLDHPSAKVLEADPVYLAGVSAYEGLLGINKKMSDFANDLNAGKRLFEAGILAMNPDKTLAPDANSTIRLTYGTIGAYEPKDGVTYHYYTTLAGVMQKEDSTNHEFIVPQKLKDLYQKKDFGQYANEKGELPVNFISNNDITGGNSGSPVLDAEGNLIGLAFDGNSEAMSGDIDFEENLQRCINLDVRYMLFIIDKYAGAGNLIQEIKIVK
jgi:hypothetical protein